VSEYFQVVAHMNGKIFADHINYLLITQVTYFVSISCSKCGYFAVIKNNMQQ